MTSHELTAASPLAQRLWGWILERYPPPNWFGFYLFYLSAVLWVRSATGQSWLSLMDLAGFIIINAFFLLLRVLDEHKDYDIDCRYHPERILQQGLITLKHLKIVGCVSILLQLVWNLYLDGGLGPIAIAWLIAIIWTGLMAKEFFCGEYLKQRLVLYATSHMVVMFPTLFWMVQMGNPAGTMLAINRGSLAVMLLAFFSGALGEVGRKIRAPEEERAGVDSYTSALGVSGALGVLGCLTVLSAGAAWWFLQPLWVGHPWLPWIATAILVLTVVQALAAIKKFQAGAVVDRRKKLEKVLALHLLLVYVVVLATLVITSQSFAFRLWM